VAVLVAMLLASGAGWALDRHTPPATSGPVASPGVPLGAPPAHEPARPQSPSSSSTTTLSAEDGEPGRPGTEDWAVTVPPKPGEVAGYTDPASVRPGQQVGLFVSSSASTVTATAYRIGGYVGGRGRPVWQATLTGSQQPPPQVSGSTRTVVVRWQPATTISTSGWPAGFYLIKLTASSGGQWQVPFVVRSPSTAGRVALVLPLTTWQAYNDWGGLSLYHGAGGRTDFAGRSYAVSFDRPYPSPGAGEFLYSALPMVAAAEKDHVPLAYLANTDLQSDPSVLIGARGYVSVGHDEYWTPLMRQRVTDARDAGTNLLITGANAMNWRVRISDGLFGSGPDRLVTGYKSAALDPEAGHDPAAATTHFHDTPGEGQQSLIGTVYECFPVEAAWTVTTPTWWGFAGTGVKAGEGFAHLMGVEADRVYPGGTTPSPMQIIANVPYSCHGKPTTGQALYYTVPSGAGVVNLNSLRWTCALDAGCRDGEMSARTNEFVTTVTRNLLQQSAKGPLAQRMPVKENLDSLHLPEMRQVYTDS